MKIKKIIHVRPIIDLHKATNKFMNGYGVVYIALTTEGTKTLNELFENKKSAKQRLEELRVGVLSRI